MKGNKGSRWYAPVTVIIGGSIIALAVAIGHGSSKALITQIITLVLGIGYFLLTRSNSDVGTIYGGEPTNASIWCICERALRRYESCWGPRLFVRS